MSIHRDAVTAAAVRDLRDLLHGSKSLTTDCFYRLRGAGVIAGDSVRDAAIRCDLYKRYLLANL